jgi:hypothetical protein
MEGISGETQLNEVRRSASSPVTADRRVLASESLHTFLDLRCFAASAIMQPACM